MAMRKRVRGSGITASERTVVTGDANGALPPDEVVALIQAAASWGDALGIVSGIEARAAAILAGSNPNQAEDSPADYARRIQAVCRDGRNAVHNGNAIEALREGLRLGVLMTEATIKVEWEKDALSGRKSAEGARRGGRKAGSANDRDRKMADEYLRRRPGTIITSETELKAAIGKRYGLKRSQSAAVIDRELKKRNCLSNEPG